MSISNRISSGLAAATVFVLLGAGSAMAQGVPQSQPNQPSMNNPTNPNTNNMNMTPANTGAVPAGQPSPEDRVFLKDALEGGMAEIQLGQLALQKSNNPDVKQFAQKMVDDHGKMGDQLKPIAQQIGVKVPDGPSKKDKATIAKMQALSGVEFDKAYMKNMVKDHKSDLTMFQSEADQGSDAAVKNAGNQGITIVNQHLQMAEQINQKINAVASNVGAQ